jgi:RHS repeat-associated protein
MDYGTCFFLNGQDPDYGPRAGVNDPSAPPHHPRVQQKSEVLSGGNQTHTATSLDKFFYNDTVDTFNNVIEKDEYPYNNSTTPWRKTFTAYNAGSSYTQNSVHLISLPVSEKVTDSGGTVKALTCYNYDEYSQTPLQGPTGMRLHDDSFYGTSNGTRGNVTTVKQWLSGATTCPNLGTALSTAYGYDIAGNIVSMLDPRTVKRAWGYADSLTNYAFPTSVTSYTGLNGGGTAFQASLTWDYNVGKPLSTTDLNNNTSNYTYADSLERLTYVTKPDSGRTSICYTDTPGSVSVTSKVAQDSGAASGCGPDQPSNASVITTVSYDGLGRKASTNVASGTMVTNFVYDGRGRAAYTSLAATGNPPSESSHCISNGEVAADGLCTPQYGTLTRFDGISRPVAVIEPGGATTTSQYIADQTLITDPQGAAKLHTADRFGNLVGVVEDPSSWNGGTLSGTLAYPTTYTFDVLNNLTAVSQSSSRGRSFTYDPVKRLLTAQNPESGTITYTYDASGNLATRVDANAKTTTYNATAYDGLNRIKQKTYSDGTTPAVTYCYDAAPVSGVCQSTPAAGFKGRLTGVINSNSWTVFNSFDPVGRVWTSTQTTGGVAYGPFSYTYKYTGALATETYPSGFVATNSFDSAGRMIGVANGSTALVSNVAYDPTGPVSGLTLGNGVIEAWTFGTAQKQPTQLIASAQQQPGIDPSYKVYDTWTWGYNPDSTNNGNISGAGITKTDWTGAVYASTGQTFGYDKVNRLTSSSESGTQVWSRGYVYDAWGNGCVTGNSGLVPNSFTPPATGNPPVCSNYSDGTNRLYIQNSTYNAAGDQTVIGGYTNAYDAENQVKTSTIGGATTTYLYDGGGRRVQKVTGGTTTIYVYDAAGELAAEYTSAAAQASACGNCYLTADTLGSTRMVTDETGMPRECHDFLPFGEEINRGTNAGCYSASTSNTLKFAGKERDQETGNDHFDARYLSTPQMRWTIPDWSARGEPVPYANLADPQTLNLYGYVRNNPLARADLDGHDQMQGPTPDTVCMVYAGCRFLTQMQNPRGDQNQAQSQHSDLKGPYVADLKSKQIAPLLDPNHRPSDKDIVGNGQCVSACSKFSGVTGDTKRWRAGASAADNSDIKPGTAIATFDNGRYPSGKDKNSAIYLGPGTKGSIWVLDQWPAHASNPAHPPQPREVLSDNARGVSNNSNAYHVILVAPEE